MRVPCPGVDIDVQLPAGGFGALAHRGHAPAPAAARRAGRSRAVVAARRAPAPRRWPKPRCARCFACACLSTLLSASCAMRNSATAASGRALLRPRGVAVGHRRPARRCGARTPRRASRARRPGRTRRAAAGAARPSRSRSTAACRRPGRANPPAAGAAPAAAHGCRASMMSRLMLSADRLWPTRSCSSRARRRRSASSACTRRRVRPCRSCAAWRSALSEWRCSVMSRQATSILIGLPRSLRTTSPWLRSVAHLAAGAHDALEHRERAAVHQRARHHRARLLAVLGMHALEVVLEARLAASCGATPKMR